MSTTLNLVDQLLDRARNLRRQGQAHASARLFQRLVNRHASPDEVAEEAHAGLAEIHLEQDEHKLARRHLTAALLHQPECAHYHYLLAVAVEDDPKSDPRRAAVHYRRCLALDPDQPEYQCDYGLFALRHGQRRAGVNALRRAAELAPDEPDMLGRVATGLRQADRADEAKALLRAALFRNPRERRFRDLWDRHQFDLVLTAQQQASQRWSTAADEPVLLAFRKPKQRRQRVGAKTVRTDGQEKLRGPKILRMHIKRKQDA